MITSYILHISKFITAIALFLLIFTATQTVMASGAFSVFYTNERVNLRTGPGTDYNRIQTLPSGTRVQVLEHDVDEWSKVIHNNSTGYIKSEFLNLERADAVSQSQTSPESPSGVVLMEWRDVRNLIVYGAPLSIYDVRSGLTYQVTSFSNGAHADVVLLTAEDTEAMKRTFGGRWTWCPRSVWVTIGDVTVAAAINGMPHGGGAVRGTGVNGHFCLHFKGSSVHNGNRTYQNRIQDAVQAAFDAAR